MVAERSTTAGWGETIEAKAEDGTRLAGVWAPVKAGEGENRKGTVPYCCSTGSPSTLRP